MAHRGAEKRIYGLPSAYDEKIEQLLKPIGFSVNQPGNLSRACLRLSDFYREFPHSQTPWHEPWAQAASLAYFFPLNYSRARAVFAEGARIGFFDGLTEFIDFGCGMGAAALAALDLNSLAPLNPKSESKILMRGIDISREAVGFFRELAYLQPTASAEISDQVGAVKANTAIISSYVLTEIGNLSVGGNLGPEALVLIEPSTRDDGRKLMQTRSDLIANGYSLWAPCTHQLACPLLSNSETDWCHDRIHFAYPEWFTRLEALLPMKNRTLTFSYLLARKTPPPLELQSCARIIGDTLREKGKCRQALCRGDKREFLSWFPKRIESKIEIEFPHGSLARIADDVELKSNEIRITDAVQVQLNPPL